MVYGMLKHGLHSFENLWVMGVRTEVKLASAAFRNSERAKYRVLSAEFKAHNVVVKLDPAAEGCRLCKQARRFILGDEIKSFQKIFGRTLAYQP